MTYDALTAQEEFANAATVRLDGYGLRALSVPPTIRLGPFVATDLLVVKGKVEAAGAHPWMPLRRARFLRERFPYWDNWATGDRGLSRSLDSE